jgi:hypothetical protein
MNEVVVRFECRSGRGRRATNRRYLLERAAGVSGEDGDAPRVPGAAAWNRRIGQSQGRPANYVDTLEFALREEADRSAVRRPEGNSAFSVPVNGCARTNRAGGSTIDSSIHATHPKNHPPSVVGERSHGERETGSKVKPGVLRCVDGCGHQAHFR